MPQPDALERVQRAVGDRYGVERELARGGMATVYFAKDLRHGRSVALKVMDATLVGAIGADRFLREIEIAARLAHPHIVPLFDSGEARREDGPPLLFYVMPFIAGETLRERLARSGTMPQAEVARLLREVGSALDYAHRQGVVHRDIKPENILVSEGHAVVSDFGIARAVLSASSSIALTETGIVVGTPVYLSPEQAGDGTELDGRSDQYSLACVVYELLTGRPPFTGKSAVALLAQHLSALPAALRGAETVSDAAERAVLRALAKDPDSRFPTVTEFAEAFAAAPDEAVGPLRLPTGGIAQRASRIPAPLTPLIGREQDTRAVLALLQRASVRLLTMHGPGGIGKTRLALDVGARASELFRDGAYFIPLAEVRDAGAMRARIAQGIGARGDPRDHLRERQALLVLDNFEQLLDAAGEVSAILTDCPGVKVLLTSQVLLRIYGEHELSVEPLAVPDPHVRLTATMAETSPAVKLFAERAAAARSDFRLDDANVHSVVEICARLDGVPLAIELAAARTRTMTPSALLAKLAQRLDLLASGARDLPVRQRTMRGAIACTHDLLRPEEQTMFRRLAVFFGGAIANTAAIVTLGETETGNAEELLTSLVDHSLLRQQVDALGNSRFLMLRPIQAFADEMLDASGERAEMAQRHAEYFRLLASDAEPGVMAGDDTCLDRLEAEHDNLRAALDHVAQSGDPLDALQMAVSLWRYWDARGYAREGLGRLRDVITRAGTEGPLKTRLAALYGAGALADSCGDYALGQQLFEQHLELTQELNNPRATSVACNNLAVIHMRQGEIGRAIPLFEAAIEALRDVDPRGAAIGTGNLGNAERQRGNFADARARYAEALALFQGAGDFANIGWTMGHLGDVARDEGSLAEARSRYRESLAIFVEIQHKRGMASALTDLGDLSLADGNLLDAHALLEEALVHAADMGDQRAMLRVFEVLAGAAAIGGDGERAIRLAGAVAGLRERLGSPLSEADRDRLERRVALAIAQLGAAKSNDAWREGLAMSMDAAVRYVTAAI